MMKNLLVHIVLIAKKVIGRDWFKLGDWGLKLSGKCKYCETKIEGIFEDKPGSWGPKRLPVYKLK